jgi:hypothetical protein
MRGVKEEVQKGDERWRGEREVAVSFALTFRVLSNTVNREDSSPTSMATYQEPCRMVLDSEDRKAATHIFQRDDR